MMSSLSVVLMCSSRSPSVFSVCRVAQIAANNQQQQQQQHTLIGLSVCECRSRLSGAGEGRGGDKSIGYNL